VHCPLLVSVVINNYNYGQFLKAAVDSAVNQSYPRCEVVVVDDGSTDGSRQLLEEQYESRVKLVFQENGGQARAVNSGFNASSGEVVLFLDSDDVLSQQAVEMVVNNWEDGLAKIQFPLASIDAEGREMGIRMPRRSLESGDVTPLLLGEGHYVTPPMSGNAFSRKVLEHLMPMPEHWRFADAYLLHAAPFWGRVKSLEQTLGFYRIHGRNQSAQSRGAASNTLTRLKMYIVTELSIRSTIESVAGSQGRTVGRYAVVGNYSFLKAELALRKLGGSVDGFPPRQATTIAWDLLRAVSRAHSLSFTERLALTCWALLSSLTPKPFNTWILSLGLAPSRRPAWLRSMVYSLSNRPQRSPRAAS
jgi:glycosyltransferase involved in cell wall biosynthesis